MKSTRLEKKIPDFLLVTESRFKIIEWDSVITCVPVHDENLERDQEMGSEILREVDNKAVACIW